MGMLTIFSVFFAQFSKRINLRQAPPPEFLTNLYSRDGCQILITNPNLKSAKRFDFTGIESANL